MLQVPTVSIWLVIIKTYPVFCMKDLLHDTITVPCHICGLLDPATDHIMGMSHWVEGANLASARSGLWGGGYLLKKATFSVGCCKLNLATTFITVWTDVCKWLSCNPWKGNKHLLYPYNHIQHPVVNVFTVTMEVVVFRCYVSQSAICEFGSGHLP